MSILSLFGKLLIPFKVCWIIIQTLFHLAVNPEIIRVAFKNLQQQKMRRNLTLLGIIIGIAAIVTLMSLGESLNASIEQQFQSLGMSNVFVEPGGSGNFASTAFSRIPEKDVRIIESVPYVELVVPFYETSAIGKKGNEEKSIMLLGIESSQQSYLEEIGYIKLKEGRELSSNDVYSLIVYEDFLDNTFEKKLSLRENISINGKKFKIVGVSRPLDMGFAGGSLFNIAITSKKAVQELSGETGITEVAVKVANRDKVPEVVQKIEARLERAHGEKDFSVLSAQNILDIAFQVLGAVQLFVLAITAIALLVGGIGIMNTMFMAVSERTREIGTMKAIGATNIIIRSIFLAEAGIVGAIGGLIGAIIGFLLALLVVGIAGSSGFPLAWSVNPLLAIGAIAFSFLLGIIAGIAPAEKAIALDPVMAIRYE